MRQLRQRQQEEKRAAAQATVDANLIPLGARRGADAETPLTPAQPAIPEVEWWDARILAHPESYAAPIDSDRCSSPLGSDRASFPVERPLDSNVVCVLLTLRAMLLLLRCTSPSTAIGCPGGYPAGCRLAVICLDPSLEGQIPNQFKPKLNGLHVPPFRDPPPLLTLFFHQHPSFGGPGLSAESKSPTNCRYINEEKVTIYIEHPVPIAPPVAEAPAPPMPLMLTAREKKKIRKQRREEREKERQVS